MQHNSFLCFTVIHCASLCFTVLHCASLCFTVLHCASLCFTVLLCTSLYFSAFLCVSLRFSEDICASQNQNPLLTIREAPGYLLSTQQNTYMVRAKVLLGMVQKCRNIFAVNAVEFCSFCDEFSGDSKASKA
jgi:hypothetical protein